MLASSSDDHALFTEKLDWSDFALVLIDLQEAFYQRGDFYPARSEIIENIRGLLSFARAQSLDVVHLREIHDVLSSTNHPIRE